MKRTFITVAGILTVVGLLFSNMKDASNGYKVGDKVTDFSLPNVDGKNVSLSQYTEAKGFIVVFTCNTCPYAKAYEQRIIDLDKKYAAQGYPVIAINPNDIQQQPDDSMEAMIKRSNEKGYTFPYLRDDSQQVTKNFGASKTPHIYLLSRKGKDLTVEYIGAIDNAPREAADVSERYVEDAIAALQKGNKPKTTEIRAIGCTIKWKES